MTVCGWENLENIGFCQPHEHLMISHGVSAKLHPALCIDDIEKSTAEVFTFKEHGGKTIIDAQPGGCNRMESALYEISKNTGVNIIASTGFHKLIFYPKEHWIHTISLEELEDFYTHELTFGMYSDINLKLHKNFVPYKAGIIKAALDTKGLTPIYKKCFMAAAKASIRCNVPMMIHIEQGSDPVTLLDTLLSWGVPSHRLLFCHMDREVLPLSYYTSVLDKGISLEFDTIGRFKYHSDEDEAALVMKLITAGYEDQLLFSLDTTRDRHRSYNKDGIGLSYLFTDFLPLIRKYGIRDEQIYKITHTNLMRVFN